ncbi:hypothetical protein LIPSTDRAFT_252986 [Lipomyces starkeyi NRRL Y-11557]|uniref:Uncharacterized protein n=1 Tax=Lipomyces starkeyi NRRL Y-11557 TaxID=675824 RepID=A0A1E3QA58_LIPST|nr:hypothetical protein LIPSTDRAFT_252986 [Lipomyces starkeyi NRRL Y-11557]
MQPTASSSSDTSVGVLEGQQEEIPSMEDDDEGMAQAAAAHIPVEAAVPSTSYLPRPPPRYVSRGMVRKATQSATSAPGSLTWNPVFWQWTASQIDSRSPPSGQLSTEPFITGSYPSRNWSTGNAGTSVDLLHQLEKEFATNWATHDRATELHTTFQATGESPVEVANRLRSWSWDSSPILSPTLRVS